MQNFNLLLTIHHISTSIFALFIIIDRIYIRVFIKEKEKREKIYNFVNIPLIVSTIFIVVSGVYLSVYITNEYLHYKIALATLLIIMFFACPYVMKICKCKNGPVIYRSIITLLLFVVIYLGIYI